MEEREQNADVKALGFINEFSKRFRSIEFTLHPPNIAGELAGKGSNMAWAARKLSERYSIGQRKDVIVTGIDGMWPACALFRAVAAADRSWSLWDAMQVVIR